MQNKLFVTLAAAIAAALVPAAARADRCSGEAEFVRAFPSNSDDTKWKLKFRVESGECDKYSCRGHIQYRIHYTWKSGGSNGKSTLVGYTIPRGQRSADVIDETFPSGASMPVRIDDVEIREVSCSTP